MYFFNLGLQESGIDCIFLHFRCIIICYVLNLSFIKKSLHSVTSYHDRCSVRNNFASSKSSVTTWFVNHSERVDLKRFTTLLRSSDLNQIIYVMRSEVLIWIIFEPLFRSGLRMRRALKPSTHCTIFGCPRWKIDIVKQSGDFYYHGS